MSAVPSSTPSVPGGTDILQRAENEFDPIPSDVGAARLYGRVCAAVVGAGRRPRRRIADLMIAITVVPVTRPLVPRPVGARLRRCPLADRPRRPRHRAGAGQGHGRLLIWGAITAIDVASLLTTRRR